MWQGDWRDKIWNDLDRSWDIIIVGGGITGAGILREATRLGLQALLIEQRDFAWGTSSRSSKLVHGGLRYLKEGKIGMTRAAVRERERLVQEGPGLIDPLGFLLATYEGDHPGRLAYEAGLCVYDLLALQWSHTHYSADDFRMLAPHISQSGLCGGFRYGDAQTDDARLVLRVIRVAVADGGVAINYVTAGEFINSPKQADRKLKAGAVAPRRLRIRDNLTDRTEQIKARVIINATGAWADRMRAQAGFGARIRPLRGSHLIFPGWRFPVAQAICILHPLDHRPVFIFPWEGITLVGTTDVDHGRSLEEEPAISPEEVAYLMAAIEAEFPALHMTLDDVISSFSGVRPVIGTGKDDPSKEARDHAVWEEGGLLTVTGGKLTTFRLIARDALKAVARFLPEMPVPDKNISVLNKVDLSLRINLHGKKTELPERLRRRLLGRYGADAQRLLDFAQPGETEAIPGSLAVWAELRFAAREEGVIHLDDLLLRRVRLGLLLPHGGRDILPRVRAICTEELGWSDTRWQQEEKEYLSLWHNCYSLPQRSAIPDWHKLLDESAEKEGKKN